MEATAGGIDHKVLHRVRALLAKAESTDHPAEAEAFTAKAQELIARHAIDRALLDATSPSGPGCPTSRTIPVPDPYAAGKFRLLSAIGSANRCRAVWQRATHTSTVIGFAVDLDAVELLHTSLLLQATTSMIRMGPQVGPDGRASTRSFRSSFMAAFATRIGERLSATTSANVAAAESEVGSVLPVLAAREDAVEAELAGPSPTSGCSGRGSATARGGGPGDGRPMPPTWAAAPGSGAARGPVPSGKPAPGRG
jgi:hypothetical protein